jgi:hypothetical protein
MILSMQVLGELENALDTCSSCSTFYCDSINSLYKAVAYYTGSMEQTSLFQMGSQLQDIFYTIPCSVYSMCYSAELGCSTYGLCRSASTTISVNLDIFSAFDAMKVGLMNNCSEALVQKEIVAKKFLVVFIQYMLFFLDSSQGQINSNNLPSGNLLFGFTAATTFGFYSSNICIANDSLLQYYYCQHNITKLCRSGRQSQFFNCQFLNGRNV